MDILFIASLGFAIISIVVCLFSGIASLILAMISGGLFAAGYVIRMSKSTTKRDKDFDITGYNQELRKTFRYLKPTMLLWIIVVSIYLSKTIASIVLMIFGGNFIIGIAGLFTMGIGFFLIYGIVYLAALVGSLFLFGFLGRKILDKAMDYYERETGSDEFRIKSNLFKSTSDPFGTKNKKNVNASQTTKSESYSNEKTSNADKKEVTISNENTSNVKEDKVVKKNKKSPEKRELKRKNAALGGIVMISLFLISGLLGVFAWLRTEFLYEYSDLTGLKTYSFDWMYEVVLVYVHVIFVVFVLLIIGLIIRNRMTICVFGHMLFVINFISIVGILIPGVTDLYPVFPINPMLLGILYALTVVIYLVFYVIFMVKNHLNKQFEKSIE